MKKSTLAPRLLKKSESIEGFKTMLKNVDTTLTRESRRESITVGLSKQLQDMKEKMSQFKTNNYKTSEHDEENDYKKELEAETLKKTRTKKWFREMKHDKKTMLEKKEMHVFWSKEKLKNIKEKFYTANQKIIAKTKKEWENVMLDLKQGNLEDVKAQLLKKDFKDFYFLDIKKSPILEEILEYGYPELVL